MGKTQPGKYGLRQISVESYGRQSHFSCQQANASIKASKSNVSKHASSGSAEMDSKKRIESQLGLLHARGTVASDSSQGHLKKVKKAPMKKAFKTKKLKKMTRAQIVADKVWVLSGPPEKSCGKDEDPFVSQHQSFHVTPMANL
ncbi:hypothetical protein NQZ79_g7241 [Umbelopsis isabellina]|nr:hypothetical protein NQZ79_g7241 [Umbelopsis isabellina]